MKKTVLGILTMLMAVTALTGCNMLAKANGVILYGEESEIVKAVEKEKDELVKEEQHKIKILDNNGHQVMILSEKTADALVKKKLINEITNPEKAKIKAVSSLSKISNGKGLLFAKKELKELNVDGKSLEIKYEGNLIIGEGRTYAEIFLIVTDEEWASLSGTEKTLAILEYDKDPSSKGLDYDVEKTQLVRIQD